MNVKGIDRNKIMLVIIMSLVLGIIVSALIGDNVGIAIEDYKYQKCGGG